MKILFCGTILPRRFETEIVNLSSAANQFQHNVIREMCMQGHEVKVYSYIAFPVEDSVVNQIFQEDGETCYVFKNGHIGKSLWLYNHRYGKCVAWADIVISYNVIYPWLRLSKLAKKQNKKSVLLLADFEKKQATMNRMRQIYYAMQVHALQRYTKVIGLTDNMREWILPSQTFMLMEGGIRWSDYEHMETHLESNKKFTFMFSGVLSKDKGVYLLLNAMKNISEDFELVITGKGVCEKAIREAAMNDKRIHFLGQVPFEKYLECLEQSDVLVNPRDMQYANNEYNFPSKFLEYLATGHLIISTKFTGWDRFQDNAYFVDSDAESIAQAMRYMIKYASELRRECYAKNREKAQEYSWSSNVKKILE